MPLYEYQCESCQHRFEVIQKFSDPAVGTCPKCGGVVRRLLSSPAIQFKGSGFYITDYPKKSGTGASSSNTSESSSSSSSGSESAAKTGTKTESKTTSAPSTPAKSD
jgi:putative FmdB family regulatory protein